MIKKATQKNQKELLDYLNQEPAINLFIIGDMLTYGFEEDFQDIWFDQDEFGVIHGVLLRFYQFFIPYHNIDYPNTEYFIDLIKEHSIEGISGKESIMTPYREAFPEFKYQSTYFAQLDELVEEVYMTPEIEQFTAENVPLSTPLYQASFPGASRNEGQLIVDLNKKRIRGFLRKNEAGEVISIASTSVETDNAGMIVAVCTKEDERGKGYGTQIVQLLCHSMQRDNKTPCLFFDNPVAGRIYHEIGFKDIDKWAMMSQR